MTFCWAFLFSWPSISANLKMTSTRSHDLERTTKLCSHFVQAATGDLVDYIKRQRIENAIFTPKDWSVYQQPIDTNKDIEGWRNAPNRRAGEQSGLPLCSLIELLDRETRITAITIGLVSNKKLKCVQHKLYRSFQARLFDIWEQYDNSQKTAIQLLKTCSHLNHPDRAQWTLQRNLEL